jgi:hypothetical protein
LPPRQPSSRPRGLGPGQPRVTQGWPPPRRSHRPRRLPGFPAAAPGRDPGRDPASVWAQPIAITAPRPPAACRRRLRAHQKQRPHPRTARPGTRPCPLPPPRAGQPANRLAAETGSCRRWRNHLRPGPAPGIQGTSRHQVARGPRGFPDRHARRSPRRTSGVRALARLAPRPRGPPPPQPPPHQRGPARLRASVRPPLEPVRTSRVRDPGHPGRGQPRRGRPVRVHPGRVRPGLAEQGRGPTALGPARGRAITHSARRRPAWARLLRRDPRHLVPPVSRRIPAVRDSLRVPPAAAQGRAGPAGSPVLVRADVDLAVPAAPPTAVRAPVVLAREVPGLAR